MTNKQKETIINTLIITSLARTLEPELYQRNFDDAIFIAKQKLHEKRILFNREDFKLFCQNLISETISIQDLIKNTEIETAENQV